MTGTPSYKELVAMRDALDAQIAAARKQEVGEAVATIRQLMTDFSLSHDDVFPAARKSSALKGSSVAPKYRDPATGATWTGRGKPPTWIKDQDREKFAI
ncbi:H-NS family nucleoid-associated regulatory protein [Acidovorax sp.]|uniref:H-NS histone family protein n=1 Tax=Acidovorax sp. TaxID=1872122 RepID=UPI00391F8786